MEFKATKYDAGLSASADEALKQIEDKHYDTDMKDRGIKEIVKYGIAFAGKNVEIAKGWKDKSIPSPTRPDLQFSLHKTMLWLMVAKLATIKNRNSFMYIVEWYGKAWYML